MVRLPVAVPRYSVFIAIRDINYCYTIVMELFPLKFMEMGLLGSYNCYDVDIKILYSIVRSRTVARYLRILYSIILKFFIVKKIQIICTIRYLKFLRLRKTTTMKVKKFLF